MNQQLSVIVTQSKVVDTHSVAIDSEDFQEDLKNPSLWCSFQYSDEMQVTNEPKEERQE